jgi:hypothetical protein
MRDPLPVFTDKRTFSEPVNRAKKPISGKDRFWRKADIRQTDDDR